MQVRCDGFNGAPGVPTPCPNLRENVSGGFLSKKVSYWCSTTGNALDYQYVQNVCKFCRFYHSNNTQYADIKYLDCNKYKIYGIRNSQLQQKFKRRNKLCIRK